MKTDKPNNIDDYIFGQPDEIQSRLTQIRNIVLTEFPEAQESIRYGLPAFKVNKIHIYFSAYKKHIGMYPIYGMEELEEEISNFRGKGTKDALHFPHNKSFPLELITKLVKYKFSKQIDEPSELKTTNR